MLNTWQFQNVLSTRRLWNQWRSQFTISQLTLAQAWLNMCNQQMWLLWKVFWYYTCKKSETCSTWKSLWWAFVLHCILFARSECIETNSVSCSVAGVKNDDICNKSLTVTMTWLYLAFWAIFCYTSGLSRVISIHQDFLRAPMNFR